MKPGLCLAAVTLLACNATIAQPGGAPDPAVDELFGNYRLRESATPVREHPRWRAPESIVVWLPGYRAPIDSIDEWLHGAAPDASISVVSTRAEFRRAAREADVVVLGDCTALDEQMRRLRWVQRLGAGVEHCLSAPLDWANRVLLTNMSGLGGPYIAEHVITMVMMLSHGMPYYYRNQLQRRWQRSRSDLAHVRAVAGRNLLVVGLGGIGTKVAEKAAGLGMRVTAIRNTRREGPDFVEYVGLSDELPELAGRADFVVNTLPLTPQTTGLYDAEFFALMKETAYFISVGRGGSVVTDDLVVALESGAIAGAGLDVTDPEPLPEAHPLWTMPNVLITPHSSGMSGAGSRDYFVLVRENIRRYVAGEKMLNVVDPARGY